MPRDDRAGLVFAAGRTLRMTQTQLGALVGVSRRTVSRWCLGDSAPSASALQRLARAVHATDPALAARLAGRAGASLESLGLAKPQPRATAMDLLAGAAASPIALELLVDSVVCAAAAAQRVEPDAIRPTLRAAFERAQAMRLSVEQIHRALSSRAVAGTSPT